MPLQTMFAPLTTRPLQQGKIGIQRSPSPRLASPPNTLKASIQLMELKSPEAVYKGYLAKTLEGEKEEERVKVSRRLGLAKEAIEFTRRKLSLGAGNVDKQLKASLQWSAEGASEAQRLFGDLSLKTYISRGRDLSKADLEGDPGLGNAPQGTSRQIELTKGALRAISAKWYGAGVCDEFAAVTFFRLDKSKTNDQDAHYRITVSNSDLAHAVVIIANPGLSAEEIMSSSTAVVADAWPTAPFAVRVSDWKYAKWRAEIKWSTADIPEITRVPKKYTGEKTCSYISRVRDVWREPYLWEEKPGNKQQAYRGMRDEFGYTGVKKQAQQWKREAEESIGKSTEVSVENEWTRKPWSDEHSLSDEILKLHM